MGEDHTTVMTNRCKQTKLTGLSMRGRYRFLMCLTSWRVVHCSTSACLLRMNPRNSPIFRFLIGDHLKRLIYKLSIVKAEHIITALMPYCFRMSCSGSAAQLRKVTTSLAICEAVAGVPVAHVNRASRIHRNDCTIIVFDQTIEKNASHGNGTTREIRVVVHSLTNFNTSRRIDVASEKREDVILIVPCQIQRFLSLHPTLTAPP